MFKEFTRFNGEMTVESVKNGLFKETGEDFLGFEDYETIEEQQEYLNDLERKGFVQLQNEEIVVYVDGE